MYVCMHACMHAYIHTYTYMCVYIIIYIYIYKATLQTSAVVTALIVSSNKARSLLTSIYQLVCVTPLAIGHHSMCLDCIDFRPTTCTL